VIFVDANIPMYLVGPFHQHKTDAQRLLESAIASRERLVTDSEVFQEILHRYVSVKRRDVIQPAFDVLLGVVDEVFSIEMKDVERAKTIVYGGKGSARDAIHVAIMERHGIKRIMTFDAGFDGVPGVTRLR
jgi:predicted nucleic acid-binding protein